VEVSITNSFEWVRKIFGLRSDSLIATILPKGFPAKMAIPSVVLDECYPYTDVVITLTPPFIQSSPMACNYIKFVESEGACIASGSSDGTLVSIYGSASPTYPVTMASIGALFKTIPSIIIAPIQQSRS
jgi:hypothetical protein